VAGIALSTAAVYTVSCAYLAIAAHRRLRAAEAASRSAVLHERVPSLARTAEAPCTSAA
jgi:hypothetical protein